MRGSIISSLRSYSNNWIVVLFIITFIAIIVRSIPALLNPAWGADFGIYYGLTNYFIENKVLFNQYNGWGNSYQYFPILYAIGGISHWITGIGLIDIMPKITPIFGGLTIPIFYFIVNDILKNKKLALISAALLSVSTFHIYQTSHTAPLTIGHFFMMLSIYFFIKFIENKKYILPLFLVTILLVMSHHFTTYFYLISIVFIMFSIIAEKFRDRNDFLILLYVTFASIFSFSYWAIIAKPVFYSFMSGRMFFSSYIVILIFYIFLFGGYFSIKKIKSYKFNIPKINNYIKITDFKKFLVFFVLLLSIALLSTNILIPGVTVRLNIISIIYSLPMIFLISISFTGFAELRKTPGGNIIKGWIIAISISFLYSIFSSNLFPHRHLEYIIIPLCIPAAIIIYNILKSNKKQFEIKSHFSPVIKSIIKNNHIKTAIIVLISVMCISNMIAAYPTIDVLNHIDERVTTPCINVINWMDGNISNNSRIASDHRLEMMLWAAGFNITYGKTNTTWTSNNISSCFFEINKQDFDYILIDDIMKNEVVYIDVGFYYYMTNNSYLKFSNQPFELLYRNASYDNNNNELHWAELYKINYDYFELLTLFKYHI